MAKNVDRAVNNDIYGTLGERWYSADDDPVALLRAESRLRNPWVATVIRERCSPSARVLDVGCGAGFLANSLVRDGYTVSGIDASPEALEVAAQHDETRSVEYQTADALALPFADASFDAVCAMDFLEHVENPDGVVAECARVLRPDGLFFFHTFNRNPLAWLVVIKGVEWFVKNTPRDLHVLRLFIRPGELKTICHKRELEVVEVLGSRPAIMTADFWKMLATGVVPAGFRFEFTSSTAIAYTGYATRRAR